MNDKTKQFETTAPRMIFCEGCRTAIAALWPYCPWCGRASEKASEARCEHGAVVCERCVRIAIAHAEKRAEKTVETLAERQVEPDAIEKRALYGNLAQLMRKSDPASQTQCATCHQVGYHLPGCYAAPSDDPQIPGGYSNEAWLKEAGENCEHGIPRRFCTAMHADPRNEKL